MKLTEFKTLIREEVRKVLSEETVLGTDARNLPIQATRAKEVLAKLIPVLKKYGTVKPIKTVKYPAGSMAVVLEALVERKGSDGKVAIHCFLTPTPGNAPGDKSNIEITMYPLQGSVFASKMFSGNSIKDVQSAVNNMLSYLNKSLPKFTGKLEKEKDEFASY